MPSTEHRLSVCVESKPYGAHWHVTERQAPFTELRGGVELSMSAAKRAAFEWRRVLEGNKPCEHRFVEAARDPDGFPYYACQVCGEEDTGRAT